MGYHGIWYITGWIYDTVTGYVLSSCVFSLLFLLLQYFWGWEDIANDHEELYQPEDPAFPNILTLGWHHPNPGFVIQKLEVLWAAGHLGEMVTIFIWAVFKTSIKTEWKLFILARNPCANLARPQWELARGQFFKIHDIHSKSCLLKLTIPLQARGLTYQANNATRKQRNSSPISSRPIMLCNPFRCIFIHFCFNYLRDFGLARSLRVHELARSLWKACARLTPFNFFKNKFHRILKSIAGSFERGSYVPRGPFQLWAGQSYPLVISYSLLLNMTIEIVDFPIENGDFP